MNSTDTLHRPARPVEDRSVLMDFLALTPSPTLGRELTVLVVTLAVLGALFLILQPEPIVAIVALALAAVLLLGRLAWGFVRCGYGRRGVR